MRDDNELVHYVPILRRIIVLVAVIIAVPVVLWTITLFVRAYVAPAKVPTFHQLAATASFNTSHNSISPPFHIAQGGRGSTRPGGTGETFRSASGGDRSKDNGGQCQRLVRCSERSVA